MPTFTSFVETDSELLGLVSGVLRGDTVAEERDPDDTQTRSLLPALEDEPELRTIHHKAELHVYDPHTKHTTKHLIGGREFNREATESAADFKARAFAGALEGHASYDHGIEDSTQHASFTPYADFNELADNEDMHSGQGTPLWMHVAAGNEQDYMIDNGANVALTTQVHHFLRVGHHKPGY